MRKRALEIAFQGAFASLRAHKVDFAFACAHPSLVVALRPTFDHVFLNVVSYIPKCSCVQQTRSTDRLLKVLTHHTFIWHKTCVASCNQVFRMQGITHDMCCTLLIVELSPNVSTSPNDCPCKQRRFCNQTLWKLSIVSSPHLFRRPPLNGVGIYQFYPCTARCLKTVVHGTFAMPRHAPLQATAPPGLPLQGALQFLGGVRADLKIKAKAGGQI